MKESNTMITKVETTNNSIKITGLKNGKVVSKGYLFHDLRTALKHFQNAPN